MLGNTTTTITGVLAALPGTIASDGAMTITAGGAGLLRTGTSGSQHRNGIALASAAVVLLLPATAGTNRPQFTQGTMSSTY